MRDLLDILAAFSALRPDEPATLATVVRVEGSSYRLPGSRMLIDAAGRRTGTVSGGCLEADIARRGRLLSASTPNALVRYDGADEDASWNYHLGCNGSIEVFIEYLPPMNSSSDDPTRRGLAAVAACVQSRRPGAMLTVFAAPPETRLTPGTRFHLNAEMPQSRTPAHLFQSTLCDETLRSFQLGETSTITVETPVGPVHALAEFIGPPLPLVIFGAGHDALPLVQKAKRLGWHVTVCDRRASYARREHFPEADRIIVAAADEVPDHICLNAESVVVIMTHHYPDDQALLTQTLQSNACYVGLLGPRARADRLLEEISASGVHFAPSQLDRLHAPIGLDLGAEGPEQVALAIVAEVLAVVRSRPAGLLRDRLDPIHGPALSRVIGLPHAAPSRC